MIELIVILAAGITLASCLAEKLVAERQITHSLGSSAASITLCSQYVEDAYSAAKVHCGNHKKDAELTGKMGTCKIPGYNFHKFKPPESYNFRCVKK